MPLNASPEKGPWSVPSEGPALWALLGEHRPGFHPPRPPAAHDDSEELLPVSLRGVTIPHE